jgi:hypothetical protein
LGKLELSDSDIEQSVVYPESTDDVKNENVAIQAKKYYNPRIIRDFYTITDIIIGQGSYAIVKMGYLKSSVNQRDNIK